MFVLQKKNCGWIQIRGNISVYGYQSTLFLFGMFMTWWFHFASMYLFLPLFPTPYFFFFHLSYSPRTCSNTVEMTKVCWDFFCPIFGANWKEMEKLWVVCIPISVYFPDLFSLIHLKFIFFPKLDLLLL